MRKRLLNKEAMSLLEDPTSISRELEEIHLVGEKPSEKHRMTSEQKLRVLQSTVIEYIWEVFVSVNSSCAQPPPPHTHTHPGWPLDIDTRAFEFFLPWMENSRGWWGLLSCQIPRGGDEKRGQMPRPPSTLQHFSLIAQSNSAVLNIFMSDFFVSSNVVLCNSARILIKTLRRY